MVIQCLIHQPVRLLLLYTGYVSRSRLLSSCGDILLLHAKRRVTTILNTTMIPEWFMKVLHYFNHQNVFIVRMTLVLSTCCWFRYQIACEEELLG
jgi:hypothetical protein